VDTIQFECTGTPAETLRRAVSEFAKLKMSMTLAAVADGHEGDPFVLVLDKITDWLTWSADDAELCARAVPYLNQETASLRHALAVARTYLGEEACRG
jgi:hypothetical protein